ncbi:MAG: M28 family peptidase [Planctomycetota bacterium]
MTSLLLLLFLALPEAPANEPLAVDPITAREMAAHIRFLASDELGGRYGGDPGAEIAALYLAAEFEKLGLEPAGDRGRDGGSYLQRFPLRSRRRSAEGEAPQAERSTVNVLGLLRGGDQQLAEQIVVVGGHFDHVGTRDGEVYNGADDNASGTSGVLEIAEALATRPSPLRRSVLFILFGAEEQGLIGSSHWVSNPTKPLENVVAMVNLDMIGRNDPGEVSILAASAELETFAVARAAAFELRKGTEPAFYLQASDSAPFVGREIPTVFLFTGIHEDYHRGTDTADRIDAAKAARVAQLAHDIVFFVAQGDKRPTFTAPAMERRPRPTAKRLGIGIGEVKDGVVVAGVTEGGVAARAGVQPKDRIIRLGEITVTNVASLTRALTEVKSGVEVELVVERPGTGEVTLKALWPAKTEAEKPDAD